MSLLCLLLLGLLSTTITHSQLRPTPSGDKVTIVKRKIVITRTEPRQFLKSRPDKRTATIYYPFVSGLPNQAVLRRVRSLVSIQGVYGMSLREHRESTWLNELEYEVEYNANHILVITYTAHGEGPYPDSHSRTITVDLKAGRILKARDVFIEQKLTQLAADVDVKLKLEVAQLMKDAKENPDADRIIEVLAELKFEPKDLDNFSISKEGVIFLFDADLPHVFVGFEPEGRYLFPYASLQTYIKPSGPLAQFVK